MIHPQSKLSQLGQGPAKGLLPPAWTGSYPCCRGHPGAASWFFTQAPVEQKLGAVQLFCTHLRIKCQSCLSPHTHPTPTALPRHREQSCVLTSKQLLYKISITIMLSDCGMQICINLFNLLKHLIQSPGKSIQSLASISYPLGSAP